MDRVELISGLLAVAIGTIAVPKTATFIVDGDSITFGQGATPYATLMLPLLPARPGTVKNLGISGETFATMLSNQATAVFPLITSAHVANQFAICSCFAGTNDMGPGGQTAAQTYTTATSYFQNCKSNGADYAIAWTVLPRNDNNFETKRIAFNSTLRSGFAGIGVDYLVDIGGDPSMGTEAATTNTTLYQGDQVHPTVLGQQILADYFAATLYQIGSQVSISGISPATGSISGAAVNATITGTGFTGAYLVSVGGIRPLAWRVVSDTSITLTTSPAYFTGVGPVMVIGPKGSAVLTGAWTWTT